MSMGTDITALNYLFPTTESDAPTLEVVLESYKKKERSLLRESQTEEEGRVKISTTSGAVVTADVVLEALAKRCSQKSSSKHKQVEEEQDVKDDAEAMRR